MATSRTRKQRWIEANDTKSGFVSLFGRALAAIMSEQGLCFFTADQIDAITSEMVAEQRSATHRRLRYRRDIGMVA